MKRRFGDGSPGEAVGDSDYQAKLEARRRDPNKTRVLVGDRYVWVDACTWETAGRRCRMAASLHARSHCPWHFYVSSDPRWAQDRAEFERWLKVEARWSGDTDYLWSKIMGYEGGGP